MADYPPFMNAPGNLSKILDKIKEAQTPDRFTHDYLSGTLGFTGGSSRPFIGLAKRIGLLAPDGSPTDLYKRFRNPSQSKAAIAQAMRRGYADLYKVNENAHDLNHQDLRGLVAQVTGLEAGSATAKAIVGTFETLKKYANFGALAEAAPSPAAPAEIISATAAEETGLRLSYTIYLNLPNTSDITVFNAIFRSLREHLLSR
jgi:hypothetical protein